MLLDVYEPTNISYSWFQRSLKSKKISGRFHFWTFGFLVSCSYF